jgi:hypothetical protein
VNEFISEDDLRTFEIWMRYQDFDAPTEEELARWRPIFDEARLQCEANPQVGLMKLSVPGEYRYAVAVREGAGLWLLLWVRRSQKGEFFVLRPTGDRDWIPHTSYHLNGNVYMKSHRRKVMTWKRQPLTGPFHGTVDLGTQFGYAPKGVGAICDPTAFTGVVEVPPGVLGLTQGAIGVALVEPGHQPPDLWLHEVFTQRESSGK